MEIPGVLLCVGLGTVEALVGRRGIHVGGLDVLLEIMALGEGLWAVGAGQGCGLGRVARCLVPAQAVLLHKPLAALGTLERGWVV